MPTNEDITHRLTWKLNSNASTFFFSFDQENRVVHHFTHNRSIVGNRFQHQYFCEQIPFEWSFDEAPTAEKIHEQEHQASPTESEQLAPPSPHETQSHDPQIEDVSFEEEMPPPPEPQQSVNIGPLVLEKPTQALLEKPSKEMSITAIALFALATLAVLAITVIGILAAIGNQTWASEALKNFAHQFGPEYAAYIFIATTPAYLIILGVGQLIKRSYSSL